MKKVITMLAVCWIALGSSFVCAQNTTSYQDTILKDGNIVIRQNTVTELRNIPVPYAHIHDREIDNALKAIASQKDYITHVFRLNILMQTEDRTYSRSYNYLHEIFNSAKLIKYEKNNLTLYVSILVLIATYMVGKSRAVAWKILDKHLGPTVVIFWCSLCSIAIMSSYIFIINSVSINTESDSFDLWKICPFGLLLVVAGWLGLKTAKNKGSKKVK